MESSDIFEEVWLTGQSDNEVDSPQLQSQHNQTMQFIVFNPENEYVTFFLLPLGGGWFCLCFGNFSYFSIDSKFHVLVCSGVGVLMQKADHDQPATSPVLPMVMPNVQVSSPHIS